VEGRVAGPNVNRCGRKGAVWHPSESFGVAIHVGLEASVGRKGVAQHAAFVEGLADDASDFLHRLQEHVAATEHEGVEVEVVVIADEA